MAHFNGWLSPSGNQKKKVTVYFEKPMANQNLMTSDGTVYMWTGDVDVNYTLKGKEYTKKCKLTDQYDNIWFRKIPSNATNVYFSESSLEVVRTVAVETPVDGNIYYVTDILFNKDMQLPMESCRIEDFDSMGINYFTVAPATEKATETETQKETQQEEKTTYTFNGNALL